MGSGGSEDKGVVLPAHRTCGGVPSGKDRYLNSSVFRRKPSHGPGGVVVVFSLLERPRSLRLKRQQPKPRSSPPCREDFGTSVRVLTLLGVPRFCLTTPEFRPELGVPSSIPKTPWSRFSSYPESGAV